MKKRLSKYKHCDSPIPPEVVMEFKFNVCPMCGNLYPQCIEYIVNYLRIIQLTDVLLPASELLLKTEFNAAVREAVVTFESSVRKKSGLKDLTGTDLMAKAFSFKFDLNTKKLSERPKIKINNLSTISKRNEQEGVKFMAMGIMQGIRNIYMHSEGSARLYYALQILTTVDLLLKLVIYTGSIAQEARHPKIVLRVKPAPHK